MHDLTYRQEKIQQKRKQTPFRDFVMEIASRQPIGFYKIEGKVSRYPPTSRTKKLINAITFLDNRLGKNPEKEYHSNGDFFLQLKALWDEIPKPIRWIFSKDAENCEYADTIGYGVKNFYLTICGGEDCTNVLYSFYVVSHCNDVFESIVVNNGCSNVFHSTFISQSYNIFYSKAIFNSSNIWFSSNLQGCYECIFCDNLMNQSYCIHNVVYHKEDYFKKKQEILGKKDKFSIKKKQSSVIFTNIGSDEYCNGSGILFSQHIQNGYFVTQVKNGRNLILVGNGDEIQESYDCITSATQTTHTYGNMGVSPGTFMYCCMNSGNADHLFYCVYTDNCHHCLGCYGMQNKSYCIFNKQYTKEERHAKVDEIFTQMENDGTLGQFFPATMNPFYFNDTAAYLIDPTFTKEEIEKAGYLRRDEPIKVDIPANLEQVNVHDLDQYEGFNAEGKRIINPDILKKVIIDDTGNCRRIVKMEYDFLVKYGLPLPRKHRLERMKENFRIG